MWRLARDPQGCRTVQEALENATSEFERQALASELHGHVWTAIQCPYANYVIQKCIGTMKAESAQFIIDEIVRRGPAATCKAARNQYGCRTLQRLLEHCFPQQLQGLVDGLLTDALRLCMHIYGNYVMRHVMEYGQAEQRHRLAMYVREYIVELGSDEKGCAVVAKALSHASRADQKSLAAAVLGSSGLVAAMACMRHGHGASEALLRIVRGEDLEEARRQLCEAAPRLESSRFGRSVLACLRQHHSKNGAPPAVGKSFSEP